MVLFAEVEIIFSAQIINKRFMKTILSFLLFQALFICTINAQSAAIDKNKVMDFFQNQQFDEAIIYLNPAAVIDTQNIQLLSYLGYANYMNDNAKAAEKYYTKVFNIDSNNIAAIQYLITLNKNEAPDEAVQFTRRLINLQPNKASNYRGMADLFRRGDKKDSALLYYNKAYQLAPDDYKNGIGLSDILIGDKKFLRADSIIQAGLEKDSINISFLKLSIRSAYEAEDYKMVLLPGEKLMRLQEAALSSLTMVFLSYYKLKLYADCIRVCDFLLSNDFLVENIFFYKAKALANLKDFSASNDLLKKCVGLSISKNAEMYYYNLALNYEALKQYKKAIANYDTAYYLFKNPVMNYNSGRICETNLKNTALAQKYYTQYLATAKPVEADEKKAYEYVKERWGKNKKVIEKNK